MKRINMIEIDGFLSIGSIKLDLNEINVLIGANGSGKSNFIEAFSFLRAITEGKLQSYTQKRGGSDRILHFGAKFTEQVRLRVHFKESTNQYEIKIKPNNEGGFFIDEEWAYFWNKAQYSHPFGTGLNFGTSEAGISKDKQESIATYVKSALKSWRVYHFHDTGTSSPMKRIADIDDNRFLREDASNLAAFLYFLKREHSQNFEMIKGALRRMAPFFDDFRLEPRNLDEERIRLEWIHRDSDAYFDASSFSDGTLRFICLATLLCQPVEFMPSVILLDEPELGLHPYAINLLGSLIRSASQKVQVILSTQSSLMLDQFVPNQVLVAERAKGGTELVRLDTDGLNNWLEDFSLGQLWEKNEIGGRPSG